MWLSTYFQIEPGSFEPSGDDALTFWKQVAYVGKFVKHVPGRKPEPFEITHKDIERWNRDVPMMLSEGIGIPMPLEHTINPEAKRGDVVGSKIGVDNAGRYSLYLKTKFKDEAAKTANLHSNVSIFVPEFYVNAATGKKYEEPITHLALTNHPVLPGLAPFQALALSFALDTQYRKKKGALSMGVQVDLSNIATELGLDPATADETAVLNVIKAWKAKMGEMQQGADQQGAPQAAASAAAGAGAGTQLPAGAKVQFTVPGPLAASFVTSRKQRIAALGQAGKVTAHQIGLLEKQFATPDAVKLALSMTEGDDGFEQQMALLEANQAQVNVSGSKTGVQLSGGVLPNPNGGRSGGADKPSPLQAATKKLADQHARRRG